MWQSSSSSSISASMSASILDLARKYGTFQRLSSSMSMSSASVNRVAVRSTTRSKWRMPMRARYVACGKEDVPTPGRSQRTQSAKTDTTLLGSTLISRPSSSRTLMSSCDHLPASTTSALWPSRSPARPCNISLSPFRMGFSNSSLSLRPAACNIRVTPSKALRKTPVRPGLKVNFSGSNVVSLNPVLAAAGSLALSRRNALMKELLPTPEPPVTARFIAPVP
mmetsp:Transcript_76522/g.234216  ORF Transcript_76522/g.234216 Transcript_76522/m.234216 type:complete len:223 (+) Transcript_76522:288-956(+)